MKRVELRNWLRHQLHEPCTRPGSERFTWLEAIGFGLLNAAVDVKPWAIKQVFDRAFGRVPIAVDASLTVGRTAAPDSTPDELLARLDMLREEARQLRDSRAIDADVLLPSAPVSIPDVTLPGRAPRNATAVGRGSSQRGRSENAAHAYRCPRRRCAERNRR